MAHFEVAVFAFEDISQRQMAFGRPPGNEGIGWWAKGLYKGFNEFPSKTFPSSTFRYFKSSQLGNQMFPLTTGAPYPLKIWWAVMVPT